MDFQATFDASVAAHRQGRLDEAERGYLQLLAVQKDNPQVLHPLGVLRAQQGRLEEAAALIGGAVAVGAASGEVLTSYGNVLLSLGRFAQASPVLDRLVLVQPGDAAAWNQRGHLLLKLERPQDALDSFQRALALQPGNAELLQLCGALAQKLDQADSSVEFCDRALALRPANVALLNCRANALRDLGRLADALAGYDRALALAPDDAATHNNRGNLLKQLQRHDAALAALNQALRLAPDQPSVLYNRGKLLCDANRIAEGFADFLRSAQLTDGVPAWVDERAEPTPQRRRHDAEQAEYLRGIGSRATVAQLSLDGGAALPGPAINRVRAAQAQTDWRSSMPRIAVVDDLLTPEALAALRRFCWGSTVWRTSYGGGYLGAFPEHGFAAPLLAQIADEFRLAFAGIVGNHALKYIWAFKYDSTLTGIGVHADRAAVNVNFWITPDDANLDPDHGGLVIWDVAAPVEWDFEQYNGDIAATRAFLKAGNARAITVPYRANRAVIFDSDLFHETDAIRFREGYLNRRINVTLLYGDRA